MNSDEDKIYMKIVAFVESYNFAVHTFFILNNFK
jgi:flagellar capping protein FliD